MIRKSEQQQINLVWPKFKTTGTPIVIVSPLIALMKDQVAAYSAKDLKVGCVVTGESSSEEKAEVVVGNFQLVSSAAVWS